jgi:hypothetical protein
MGRGSAAVEPQIQLLNRSPIAPPDRFVMLQNALSQQLNL